MTTLLTNGTKVTWLHTGYEGEIKQGMIVTDAIIPEADDIINKIPELHYANGVFSYEYTDIPSEPVVEETEIKAIVPEKITARQLKSAMILAGINLTAVDAIIATLPQPQLDLAMVNWEYSTSFYRNNSMINQIAGALKLTHEQVDAIFVNGEKLINDN